MIHSSAFTLEIAFPGVHPYKPGGPAAAQDFSLVVLMPCLLCPDKDRPRRLARDFVVAMTVRAPAIEEFIPSV